MNPEEKWWEDGAIKIIEKVNDGFASRFSNGKIMFEAFSELIVEATRRGKLETWEEIKRLAVNQQDKLEESDFEAKDTYQNMIGYANSRIQQYGKQE